VALAKTTQPINASSVSPGEANLRAHTLVLTRVAPAGAQVADELESWVCDRCKQSGDYEEGVIVQVGRPRRRAPRGGHALAGVG
jgi:hypothetical protein